MRETPSLLTYPSVSERSSDRLQTPGWICLLSRQPVISRCTHCTVVHCPEFYNTELVSDFYLSTNATQSTHTHTFIINVLFLLFVFRAESDHNPWVVLTSALLTHCQGSEAKIDLGQQIVSMVRTLYNTKHKLPVQVIAVNNVCALFFLIVYRCGFFFLVSSNIFFLSFW